jgi:arylsulfate sulfotransferase
MGAHAEYRKEGGAPLTQSRQILLVGTIPGILAVLASLGCGNASGLDASLTETRNPLVANYSVTVPPAGGVAWVEFGPDTNYGRQTSLTQPTTADGQAVSILVAGMKANTTYHLRGHVSWPDGQTWDDQDRTFMTGKIDLSSPGIVIKRPTPGLKPAAGVELFNGVGPGNLLRAFVTDLEGNVIWYDDLNPEAGDPTPLRPMTNGHFLMNIGDLREIDLAGNIIRRVTTDQVNQSLEAQGYSFTIARFHHDVIVLPNGHWITLSNYTKNYTNLIGFPGVSPVLGDALIDIDLNGKVAWAWSAFDWLDVNRHLQAFPPDWTHSNTIIYTPDGNLLLSMRHQSWILKINYAKGSGDGHIIWKLGWEGDFALAGGDVSDWFYAQHFPHLESTDGSNLTLDIFDNGNFRVAPDGSMCSRTCYSRATIFNVDESSRVATLNWQYLPGVYSSWGGSIGTLSNGDVEFDLTTIPGAKTPTSEIMEISPGEAQNVVWQLTLTGESAYRGYRIPSLYPGVTWNK